MEQILSATFPHLSRELRIRDITIRNRILSTGHQTYLAREGRVTDALVAYHEARARGGAGLIITEATRFHDSSLSGSMDLLNLDDSCVAGLSRLAQAVKGQGARIFGQLSHAGRVTRRMQNGMRGIVYAPSPSPEDRFHVTPREMPADMVADLVGAAGRAAGRYRAAGYDGVELMASHGLLFAQFLNPRVNRRRDQYGGPLENRMRALTEALTVVRHAIGAGMVLGLRISAREDHVEGLESDEVLEICTRLSVAGLVDYFNITMGSMAGLGSSVHVVPPMELAPAYVAPEAGRIRAAVAVPVLVAGRINQPQIAEQVLARGQADMCAMTRALITDPDLPRKTFSGQVETIRACIGCNQGCIGHFHAGVSISCIQSPRTGRELALPEAVPALVPQRVVVIGGGPAGMKAAVTAAEAGHRVVLYEAGPQLGGQALLAQKLPGRAEFGGLITNLEQELRHHQVRIRLNTPVSVQSLPGLLAAESADLVILASGSTPVRDRIEGEREGRAKEGGTRDHVLLAEDVISGAARPGARVLVADWRCDWIGIGVALQLAGMGHDVRLAVNGLCAGQNLPIYLRDHLAARLHRAGIAVIPYARLFGIDEDTAYLTHTASGEPILCEGVDSVVLANGRRPVLDLEAALEASGRPHILIGDCMTARSAEEAIYEGLIETRRALDRLQAAAAG